MYHPINIETLIVNQDGLRNIDQLDQMIKYVRNGGVFDKESLPEGHPIIHLVRFEDGRIHIQDGHHRLSAILLGGREQVLSSEYRMENTEYDKYQEINFDCGWITPFDPRTEFRLSDLDKYRKLIRARRIKRAPHRVAHFIQQNKHRYKKPREFFTIPQLIAATNLNAFTYDDGLLIEEGLGLAIDHLSNDATNIDCCRALSNLMWKVKIARLSSLENKKKDPPLSANTIKRVFDERLGQPVRSLKLSLRATNMLDKTNIRTIAELILYTEAELLKMGLGTKTVRELEEALAVQGLV